MIGAGGRRAQFAVSLFAVMLLVSGCSARDRTSAAATNAPAVTEAAMPAANLPMRPTIATASAAPANKSNALDDRCNSNADCVVKDVGSCCGYRPACLNRDSPTFADAVKARCKAESRMGMCGGIAVSGCQCSNGHCAAHALDNRVLLP